MIYSFLSVQFWAFSALSVLAFFVSFYLCGSVIVRNFRLKSAITHILLANVLGLVMWGIQASVFGYLGIRWLSYGYLLFFVGMSIWHWREELRVWQNLKREFQHSNKFALILILIGMIVQSLAMVGSGVQIGTNIEFFRTNSVDGILHLAYIQSMMHQFPPIEPGASGLLLLNYHYWSDLVIAEICRVWMLPVSHTFFQFFPPYISFLTGVATYLVVRYWKGSRLVGLWSLFLLYWAGDGAYIFMLFFKHIFGFYSPDIDNGVTQFLNVPHTFAKLIFLTALIPLHLWLKTNKPKWGIFTAVLLGSLIGFKVYFGIFAGVGFGFLLFVKMLRHFWKTRKIDRWSFGIGVLALIFSAAIYLPVNRTAGGLFYSPLEWPKIFLGKDALDWQGWWLRQQVYEAAHNWRNVYILDAVAIVICLVCIYGTRLLGFYPTKKLRELLSIEELFFFIPAMIIFVLLGLYTLQTSGLFNVFNFFAVSVTVVSLFAAFTLAQWQTSKNLFWKVMLVIFVILSLPRPLNDFAEFITMYQHNKPDVVFDQNQMLAFNYIKNNVPKNAIVQGHPRDELDRKTPYLAFFTDHSTYITGMSMLESHNRPTDDRKKPLINIFDISDPDTFVQRLRDLNISYLYLQKNDEQKLKFDPEKAHLQIPYQNDEAMVIKL